jgi:hypothetical protein
MEVRIHQPDRMSLPGLLAAGILQRRLGDGGRKVSLRGDVVLDVAGAQVTLRFGDGTVEVTRDEAVDPIAEIHGGYASLVALASGHRVRAFRAGMRVRGGAANLIALLALFRPNP